MFITLETKHGKAAPLKYSFLKETQPVIEEQQSLKTGNFFCAICKYYINLFMCNTNKYMQGLKDNNNISFVYTL